MIVVGLDVGSSRIKAVAYDESGAELAEAAGDSPATRGTGGRMEQDADAITRAALNVLARVAATVRADGRAIDAVSLSAPMHAVVALSQDGTPLSPVITWADARASAEARFLRSEHPDLFARTGTPVHPMSPLAKLVWFRAHDPATWERAATWMSLKDYLLFRLTGEVAAERSTAAASGLLRVDGRAWDETALTIAGLDESRLPRVVPITETFAVGRERAGDLGVSETTVVVAGVSDGVAATLGVGGAQRGVWSCSIGTSAAVRWLSDRPLLHDGGKAFCYAVAADMWLVGGATNNAGLALQWALDELFGDLADDAAAAGRDLFDHVDEVAAGAPAGAGGLLFVPYLSGERAPQWDPDLSGALVGLKLGHGRAHVLRAVLEGVVYQIGLVVDVLRDLADAPHELRATGGGFAHSPLWPQIMASALETDVVVTQHAEAATWGAALVGLSALTGRPLRDLAAGVREDRRFTPRAVEVAAYREARAAFARLVETIDFAALRRLRSGG